MVLRGLAKAFRMIVEPPPPNKQHVLVLHLEAALKLMRDVAGHGRDNPLSLLKRLLELGSAAGPHVQDRHFQNHALCHSRVGSVERMVKLVERQARIAQ